MNGWYGRWWMGGILVIGLAMPRGAAAAEPAEASKTMPPTADAASEADAALQKQLKSATQRLANEQTYQLRYKFEPGEVARWRVVQLVTVDTKIRGSEQVAKTRSVSTKVWTVRSVDAAGNITFVHQVNDADMWQSTSDGKEVRYNSRVDATAPREYVQVANSVGRPLATITLSPAGRILGREVLQPHFSPNTAELAIPLPEQPVRIGAKWNLPDEVRVRLEDGRVQRIQTRQVFTLEKVETGIATIAVRTDVLTPVHDPKTQAQLVQKLVHGRVKFDLEAGRLRSKQIDLDETVVAFSGADSVMQYLARSTEEQISADEAERVAASAATAAREARRATVASQPQIVRASAQVANSSAGRESTKAAAGTSRK